MYFVAGNGARLGSLAVGFGLVVLAAFLRARWNVLPYLPMVLLSGGYFMCLAFLTKVQGHAIWYDPIQRIFCVICLVLFWAGFILAQEKRQSFVTANQWSLVAITGIAVVALLSFMRYVKAISFHGSARGFAETTLNPVGVAFANSCLGLVFVVLALSSKSVWRKVLFAMAGALAFFVVLSSASRGAVIWATGAMAFYFVLNRHRKYLSPKSILFAILGLVVIVPALVVLYKTNYGVAERIDVLVGRFKLMFETLTGQNYDPSMGAREMMWDYYLSNWDQWLVAGEKGYVGYPHNQWIEIGARFGFLGLPMLCMSFYIFGRLGVSIVQRNRILPDLEYSIITTLFVFGYLQSMSSLTLHVNRVLWLGFGYMLGRFLVQRRAGPALRR